MQLLTLFGRHNGHKYMKMLDIKNKIKICLLYLSISMSFRELYFIVTSVMTDEASHIGAWMEDGAIIGYSLLASIIPIVAMTILSEKQLTK